MKRVKSGISLLFTRLRIKTRKITKRCPRPVKVLARPVLGALIGLIAGGILGLIIGLLLGYFLGELFRQTNRGKRVIEYLQNPGTQQINEYEPGMAAWCALGVLIASENQAENQADSAGPLAEKILKQVFLEACYVFNSPSFDPSQIEYFSLLAWEKKDLLNPDLLAESFAFKRSAIGDTGNLSRRLSRFAHGEKAKILAREIRLIIDPASKDEERLNPQPPKDPWKILGLPPGTSLKEIKAHYRRLAKQFHPDNLAVLDEKQRDTAAQAFMAIKEAYQQIAKPNI